MNFTSRLKIFILSFFLVISFNSLALSKVSVDSCNRSVTFDNSPERAISNDVNLTEMMLVLGLSDRMVGYTGISGWNKLDPEMREGVKELPELSEKYPSKEVLVGADADFFFAGWNYGMKVGGEVTPETLEPFGIKVYELTESCAHIMKKDKASIEDMYNDLLNLGRIFGEEEPAPTGDFMVDEKNRQVELTELGHEKVEQELTSLGLLDDGIVCIRLTISTCCIMYMSR